MGCRQPDYSIGDSHKLREQVESFLSIASTESQKDEEPREANRNQQGRSSSGLITDIQRERRLLFEPYPSKRGKNASTKLKVSEKSKHGGWTVNFMCLADKTATTIPPTTEKEILHNAGLGAKQI